MDNNTIMCECFLKGQSDLIEVGHSQESHAGNCTQLLDFLDKCVKLSDKQRNHTDEHSKGKKYLKSIKASISTDSTNDEQNSNDNVDSKQDISIKIPAESINESEFSTELELTNKDIISHLEEKENYFKHFQNVLLTYEYMSNISKKIPANAKYHSAVTTVNPNSKDDTLYQTKNRNSNFFVSSNIRMKLNEPIEFLFYIVPEDMKTYECHTEKVVNYNQISWTNFLDLEETIFICNEKEQKNIKSNLKFYVPYSNNNKLTSMLCLVCNHKHSYNLGALYNHIYHKSHVQQVQQLCNKCEEFELLKELIKMEPDEDLQNVKILQCHACNTFKIGDCKRHIHSPYHKENRTKLLKQFECILEELNTLWYSIEYFACTVCRIRFARKIDFMQHLNITHNIVDGKSIRQKFNFCMTCATLWYNNQCNINYQSHCQEKVHKYLEKKKNFVVMPLPEALKKLLQNIDGVIADLFKQSNDVLNDTKSAQIRDDLKRTFEDRDFVVEVCPFGSRVTGLALPNSDLDVYLNFSDEYIKAGKRRSKLIETECMRKYGYIRYRLHNDYKNWKIESILKDVKRPTIKVKHRLTGLQCVISLTNNFSIENSKLIKCFNKAYPPCQKLILFLRKWISLGYLNDCNGITGNALTWLVIFYLQVRYNIPSIAAIKNHNQSEIVSGWETRIGDTIPINMPELSIHELLLGFFEYYGSFDYIHCVICPFLGETCHKKSFATIWSSLDTVKHVQLDSTIVNIIEYFNIDSPMYVQDPFDLSHNLTKIVSVLTLKRFKQYCNESLSELRKLQAPKKQNKQKN